MNGKDVITGIENKLKYHNRDRACATVPYTGLELQTRLKAYLYRSEN